MCCVASAYVYWQTSKPLSRFFVKFFLAFFLKPPDRGYKIAAKRLWLERSRLKDRG